MKCLQLFLRWYWCDSTQTWNLRLTPFGRSRATVWLNGTWATWDKNGMGGENSFEREIWQSKAEAYWACVRQGFI